MKDYYSILGVSREASDADIKSAFRTRAKELHPDRNRDDPDAEKKFKELNEAWQTLGDPEKKRAYDSPIPGGIPGWDSGVPHHWNVDIDDLINDFFRGRRPRGQSNYVRPERGRDVDTILRISFLESLQGATKHIDIRSPVACGDCKGRGDRSDKGPITCPECHGRGVKKQNQAGIVFSSDCRRCGGGGRVPREPCGTCNSKGSVDRMRNLKVTIPAGVADGNRVRLHGQGGPGKYSGPAGDIYISISVAPNPLFKRHGDEIHSEVRVPYSRCVLGGPIDVELPDGRIASMTIAPGTAPGSKVVRRRGGFPSANGSGHVGNHYVEVVLAMPGRVTPRMKDLLRQLEAETSPD